MNDTLTVREAAEQLRVKEATVRGWCRAGKVPAVRIGRDWRISAWAVQNFRAEGWRAAQLDRLAARIRALPADRVEALERFLDDPKGRGNDGG